MFVMFINDLINTLDEFGVSVKVFADDLKMYIRVLSNCDVSWLQCATNALADWAVCGRSCLFLSVNAPFWILAKVQYHWVACIFVIR